MKSTSLRSQMSWDRSPPGPLSIMYQQRCHHHATTCIKELTTTRVLVCTGNTGNTHIGILKATRVFPRRTMPRSRCKHYKRTIIFATFHWKHTLTLAKMYNPERASLLAQMMTCYPRERKR